MASPKRRTRPRRSLTAAGPALALAVAVAAAGCTSSSSPAASASTSAGTSAAALTTAQASEIFDAYRSSAPAARYAYGRPAFSLPEAAGYPRFFLASVTRTRRGATPSGGTAALIAGVRVPADGRALLVFEQASATAPWLLASTSLFPSGMTLPPLATDKNGYIPRVPLSAATLLARPDVTGPLQAAVVDDGAASAAMKAVAAGPLTTGVYQAALDHVDGLTAPRGDIYQWELEGTPYPTFALRTASGGALVLYTMYLNSTVAVPGVISKASPIQPGPPIQVPAQFLPLLPARKAAPRKSLEVQDLLSFAAIDPPAGPAKITVIAIGGGPDYATAS